MYATGQEDDFPIGYLLDQNYFKGICKMFVTDLTKQQALNADLKAIPQINLTRNLVQRGETLVFFLIEKAKKAILDISQGNTRVL